jgi:hypothetical protein
MISIAPNKATSFAVLMSSVRRCIGRSLWTRYAPANALLARRADAACVEARSLFAKVKQQRALSG